MTIAALRDAEFDVMIIPFTWEHTNLHARAARDRVNLECDMVGKYVARAAQAYWSRRSAGQEMTSKNPKMRIARRKGPFASIEEAIEAIGAGQMIIVVDDEDRENEGDLTMAASAVTADAVNFMARYGRGLICLALMPDRLKALEIPLEATNSAARRDTAFCVSIDAQHGTSTGISAADRARTVKAAIDPDTKPQDLARPGHVFPLRARDGGVMVRAGHTEAAVDLARIAGLESAGVICEIMNDDGTMARVPELTKFAKKHGLLMVTIADLISTACGPSGW